MENVVLAIAGLVIQFSCPLTAFSNTVMSVCKSPWCSALRRGIAKDINACPDVPSYIRRTPVLNGYTGLVLMLLGMTGIGVVASIFGTMKGDQHGRDDIPELAPACGAASRF